MNELVKKLFVEVVRRKMKNEYKTADEVLTIYTKLTDVEKKEIKNTIAEKEKINEEYNKQN